MQIVLSRLLILIVLLFPLTGVGQVVFEQRQDVVLLDGERSFQLPWIGGLNSSQYNKADLDGDGQEELILYDRSANVFQIFYINNATYTSANELCVLLPDVPPGWILFVDYNSDGKKDVFSNGERGVIVYENISDPGNEVKWKKVADPLLTKGFSGKINLIANAADVPAITDIDGDGDMDILVYNFAIGGYIRYNKNLSQELFGHSDSLEYEINTRSWGEFEECDCNQFAFNGETCEDISGGRVMHPGGKSLLAFDNDGDGDKDLLVGHEQCIEFYFYENMGDADSAYMVDYSNMFPDAINPANFNIFPAGFLEDINFDGVKDLIVTPAFEENYGFLIDFSRSNWFYSNSGTDANPKFEFEQNDLFQNQMLDLGESSVPVFADLNGDGDSDILLAANGYWNGSEFSGYVVEIENTGNSGSPSFSTKDKNYLNLANLDMINPKISMVDFNADSALDLVYSGMRIPNIVESWIFFNQAEAGQSVSFSFENREQLVLPEAMTISDSPTFFDVDEDGYADMLNGKGNGALEYYQNNGDNTFSLVDAAYLGIDRDFSQEKRNLVASIGDVDANGQADLIATDSRGVGRVYFDFQQQRDGSYFFVDLVYTNSITEKIEPLKFDQKSWISSADIFNKGNESIVAGGVRGGLQMFENMSAGSGGDGKTEIIVNIYPNPLGNYDALQIDVNQNVKIELISILGQQMIGPFDVTKYVTASLDLAHLRSGTYILRSENENGVQSSKLLMILK